MGERKGKKKGEKKKKKKKRKKTHADLLLCMLEISHFVFVFVVFDTLNDHISCRSVSVKKE